MFARRILHYAPGPHDLVGLIADRAVAGAWFELHRQGGCGAGELRLRDQFPDRNAIDIGHWIAFEYAEGERWYLGRVEHRQAASPNGIVFRLEGMSAELGEVFPGGFGRTIADGIPPHRYANTDLFSNDPDRADETVDTVSEPSELVSLLLDQYVAPRTHIAHNPTLIEPPLDPASVTSLKFRGEESVRAIVKELALRARNAAWGVNEAGDCYFLRPRSDVVATYREGVDLLRLEESRDREHLFNRVLLTGDYVYNEPVNSEVTARGFYRWRGTYLQPASRAKYGDRRIRLWVPWIRTATDSREFTREFFRTYAEPMARYLIEVTDQSFLPRPWLGRIRLLDREGHELITAQPETLHVQFDRTPRFRLELGPEDPRLHWPEPPHDERWEIPQSGQAGDILTLPPSDSGVTTSPFSSDESSDESSDLSSGLSSDPSSDMSSNISSAPSSDLSSADSENLSDSDASSLPSSEATGASESDVTSDATTDATSGITSSDDTNTHDESGSLTFDTDSEQTSSDLTSSASSDFSEVTSVDDTLSF